LYSELLPYSSIRLHPHAVAFVQQVAAALALELGRAQAPAPDWQPIATAPKNGIAILGFGVHVGSPPDAQRGVQAGDYWWAIMLWDIWRTPDAGNWGVQSRWVFAKDGTPTWSQPTHWMPLPAPPSTGAATGDPL
jgi:hypothetical protein